MSDVGATRIGTPAESAMRRVLNATSHAVNADLGSASVAVHCWRHEALHGATGPMAEHVLITYRGAPRRIARRSGRTRSAGWTRAGTVTTIAAGGAACWDIEGQLDAVQLYVPPAALHALADQHDLPARDVLDRTAVDDVRGSQLLSLLASAPHRGMVDRLYIGEIADRLALHLLSAHSGDAAAGPVPMRGGLSAAAYRRALDYLEAHLGSDIAIADLAATVGLSVFHFCRAFKQTSGVAPYQWRQLRRVERAFEMLRGSELSVTEIAGRLGYDDPSQLSRLFRVHVGTSPRDVRRECPDTA